MAGHFVQALATRLSQRGHQLKVWAPNDGASPTEIHEDGIVVHRFDYPPLQTKKKLPYGNGILPNLKANPRAALELPRFIKALKKAGKSASNECDLVHAHWTLSALGIPSTTPFVVSARGSDLSGAGGPLIQYLSRSVIKRARGVIAENDALSATATPHNDNVTVLGNGVDLNQYSDHHDKTILSATKLESRSTIFLFVGRLNHVKGADRFLQALESMPMDDQWGAVFVGEGAMRSAIESSPVFDRILLTGELPTEQVTPYYQAADALVLSSRHEGRPNCVMEALSCGLPVIAFDIPGVRALIVDQQTGFLVTGNHPADLAKKLMAYSPTPSLREKARTWAEAHVDWEKVVDQYEAFYEKTL